MNAWYFKDGIFYPQHQQVTNTRDFTTLPSRVPLRVTPQSLFSVAKIVPLSMLASHLQRLPLGFDLDNSIAFFDIETDRKGESFKLGIINGTPYYDADSMIQALAQHKVRVAHNMYRFDYPVLYKNSTSPVQHMGTYDLNSFKIHYIKNGINLDTMFFFRLYNFPNIGLYDVARELSIPFKRYTEFNLDKCIQDVEVLTWIFHELNIPAFCEILNKLVSVDLHILQNVFYDKFLRYLMLNQYLNEGLLPTEYPKAATPYFDSMPDNLLKCAAEGEYRNVYYYDVQNAYPNTAMLYGQSIYAGEHVLTNLLKNLMQYMNEVSTQVRNPLKHIANSLIGYMNDRNNYFSNPIIWYNTVKTFNDVITQFTKKMSLLWANTDGFIIEKQVRTADFTNYTLLLKDVFKYIRIYHPNKYVAVNNEGKTKMKGFNRITLEGLKDIDTQFKQTLPQILDVAKTMKALQVREILADSTQWLLTIKKTSDTCHNVEHLKYWELLDIGFNDVQLTMKERKEKLAEWQKQFN